MQILFRSFVIYLCLLSKLGKAFYEKTSKRNNYYILYNAGNPRKNWSYKIRVYLFYENKLSSIDHCKLKPNHFYAKTCVYILFLSVRAACNIIYEKSKCFIASNAVKITKSHFFTHSSQNIAHNVHYNTIFIIFTLPN